MTVWSIPSSRSITKTETVDSQVLVCQTSHPYSVGELGSSNGSKCCHLYMYVKSTKHNDKPILTVILGPVPLYLLCSCIYWLISSNYRDLSRVKERSHFTIFVKYVSYSCNGMCLVSKQRKKWCDTCLKLHPPFYRSLMNKPWHILFFSISVDKTNSP